MTRNAAEHMPTMSDFSFWIMISILFGGSILCSQLVWDAFIEPQRAAKREQEAKRRNDREMMAFHAQGAAGNAEFQARHLSGIANVKMDDKRSVFAYFIDYPDGDLDRIARAIMDEWGGRYIGSGTFLATDERDVEYQFELALCDGVKAALEAAGFRVKVINKGLAA